MSLGSKLRELRKSHNLTLEQMANKLNEANPTSNFNKGRLSKWENGNDEPRLSSLKQVADLFNVNIDYFFENGTNNEQSLSKNQKLVAYSIDPDISDEERRDIIEMVKIAMKNRRRV